jgi:ubiquinone/menaquinone biosynthesis C-methylase UbiE
MKLFKIEGIPAPGAKIYSTIVARSPVMKDFYHEVAEEVLAKISSGRILDVGTGPGYLPFEIARNSPALEIRAIDISPAMVRIARENSQTKGLSGRVEFQSGSAESMPFETGYFDLVVSTASFHHWAKPKDCLKEIYRVLKNGGEAWIYDLNPDIAEDQRRQLRKKYGWFLSGLVLNVVKLHSLASLQEVRQLISSPELDFSSARVENRGILLKQHLTK